jgi:CBS domain-containing protein
VLGVLSQLDLMSYVSNHSHLIALQIEQAESVAQLRTAGVQMDNLVALLHSGGVRVDAIAALVRELNAKLMRRIWTLIAPAEVVAASCLIVMGSEGRGEQILKTDQDNALLLRDGFDDAGIDAIAAEFSAALSDVGFPPCPGDIMLTNPLWRQPLARFKDELREWLFGADPSGVMHLAIFLDGAALAGDADLLRQARRFVQDALVDNDAFLARFAAAADQFAQTPGWWQRWTTLRSPDETPFDLKKLGTFPIVHGARAMALQYRIEELSTVERLAALSRRGVLDASLGRDLTEALHFLMGLKVKHQLAQIQSGLTPDNRVLLAQLGGLERDTLKDSLAIVKRFRQFLQQHFKLDAL